MDRMVDEVRVSVRVTKREPVRLEEEPHQRSLIGVRHPLPHGPQPRTMLLRLGGPPEGSQSIAYPAEDLHDEALLRAEMMEQDRRLGTERGGQGPQRQVGDAVSHDVVDRAIEKFLSALRIEGPGHHRARR